MQKFCFLRRKENPATHHAVMVTREIEPKANTCRANLGIHALSDSAGLLNDHAVKIIQFPQLGHLPSTKTR